MPHTSQFGNSEKGKWVYFASGHASYISIWKGVFKAPFGLAIWQFWLAFWLRWAQMHLVHLYFGVYFGPSSRCLHLGCIAIPKCTYLVCDVLPSFITSLLATLASSSENPIAAILFPYHCAPLKTLALSSENPYPPTNFPKSLTDSHFWVWATMDRWPECDDPWRLAKISTIEGEAPLPL